jgi:SAM-dependent methyltransferase
MRKFLDAILFKLGIWVGPLISRDFLRVIHANEAGLDNSLVFHTSSTEWKKLDMIFREIKTWNLKQYVLMDVGCGTGYVLNRWSKYFKKVIGVEINPISFKIAQSNLRRKDIALINDDVRNIDLSGVDIFFLYNPFPEEIMLTFIRSIKRGSRVIYLNPTCHSVLVCNGMEVIKQIDCGQLCLIYYKSL